MDFSRYISLAYPYALVLGLALTYLYARRLNNRNLWRGVMLALALLLLCYPSIVHTTKAFDLYLLVDRSRSIADEGRKKQSELIDLFSRSLEGGDRMSIVSFNDRAYIEQAPDGGSTFTNFNIPYSEDASDLAEGLQTALSLISPKRRAKICVLSDGEYTGQNPVREAHTSRQMNVPIYYRNLKRVEVFNLSVKDVIMPEKILEREPFRVAFNVTSTHATPGRYRVHRNGRAIGAGDEADGWRTYEFQNGENVIQFTDTAAAVGIHSYMLEVEPTPRDRETLQRDNFATRYVKVVGERPVLIVNNTGGRDNVASILSAGGLKSHVVKVDNFRFNLNQIEGYKAIILNNVPVLSMTLQQLEGIRDFVLQEGGGLLICGGNRSFAAGGYYKSALDPILPVSLEDRQQSKKVSTAFSIVLDRSGSMAMTTPSGKSKMDLANNASAECVALMSGADSLSVIAVDSQAHVIIDQQPVSFPQMMMSEIRSIESMGGGIFVYTGLVEAGRELMRTTQLNKHILLFGDAADSEEPGAYKKLLADYRKAGITVSVVGLGTEQDVDADFLKDIADRGAGTAYFTNDPNQLTQFFTADTITYTRNSFIEEGTPMTIKASAFTMSPEQTWSDFGCSGYNLMFTKAEAEVAIETADGDAAPVLAFWQRELGRVVTVALDTQGAFGGNSQFGDIMLSAARWAMGSNVDDNLQIKIDNEGSYARVRLEVSREERERMGQVEMTIFTPSGQSLTRPMQWDSQSRLSSSVKLAEPGCYRGVVKIGDKTFKIGPMSIPVSPEFLYDRDGLGADRGKKTLARMASITGGKEALDVRDLFERTKRSDVVTPVLKPFLVAFLILLMIDIAESRFGLLHMLRGYLATLRARMASSGVARRLRPSSAPVPETESTGGGRPMARSEATDTASAGSEAATEPAQTPPKAKEEPVVDMSYLSKSKQRAQQRFGARKPQ